MESTTLNTYTAPMYVVELLTKILNAVGNITGGDGTDLQDIKTSISNIDTDTNDMNGKLTAISGDLTTASSALNNISSTTQSAKSTIDNIDNTLTTNIVTSITTLLEYLLAANNKLNFMNPTHLGVVAEGDTSFEQPVVLCNCTTTPLTLQVIANGDTSTTSLVFQPGWNPVVIKQVNNAVLNTLVYGY